MLFFSVRMNIIYDKMLFMNTFTEKFNKSEFNKVRIFFESIGAEFSQQQYAEFRAKTPQAVAILYSSGKFLMQGSDVTALAQEFCHTLGKNTNLTTPAEPQQNTNSKFIPHIGVDESGKGDFFGPLVIAGVLATEENSKRFIDEGIKDSKKLSDEKIIKLAGIIKANSTHSIVVIGNEKYNELYAKFNNLNKLLAWGHARVIENILEKQLCTYALSDKFGNENLIKNALLEKGKKIKLEQRVRAEEDIAVAAASVLARAEYVNRMNSLSSLYEIELPKGASVKVLETAKLFVKNYNKDKLKNVAKLHFKTTTQI